MARQTLVIRIDEALVRRALGFINGAARGYSSLNEFVEIALLNQLNVEEGPEPGLRISLPVSANFLLLKRPADPPPSGLTNVPPQVSEALFVLTNRLSPAKVAARVLANLGRTGEWPEVHHFHESAARAARELGLRLREDDKIALRNGSKRRAIGYPVGYDERAALERFIFSFTIQANGRKLSGPLAVFGLAAIAEGRVVLTGEGWGLAAAPSPLIDGAEGATLSPEEVKILRNQLLHAPAELEAVREFLSVVDRAAGQQRSVDQLLVAHHHGWTADLVAAHRSAMVGRLTELGILGVSGRGPAAHIRLLPPATELQS